MAIKWHNDGTGFGTDEYGRLMHDGVYRESVKGAKAGQKEPRKPNIGKDTVSSISTVKILYGLAEGEVYGLADGAKSIRLDGTPLLDDTGNPNFEGVTWDFRNGSNDQEYIKGFPDVSNETPVNVELRSSQPWIKAFNDTQLSAVRIRFKWNRLSQTNGENGDVTGYKIDYAIDLQTDGGVYQTVLTTKIQDKTSAGYERTHRIDLPKAKTGWQLRVRRITPNSTSDLIQDMMMIDAVAEVIDVKLSYPNTALLGVQYNAELFSNIAKMSVRVKGKIIRVPDNYDPVARTYTGIWTGSFKDAYSNNPAWIWYDLCTQWRGGLGERLDATMIDRWSLYALGQYCDQPVSDGQGGLEPRFTCNVYLQKQEDAYTVLQNIAGIFRAMSFWNGEKIFVDADVPQDSIYTYSAANIVGGVAGIEYSGTRNRDRHTLTKVAWDNPNNDYQTEYEYIRDEKSMSKFGVKVLDLSAFGCTSQAQAQRAGLWALRTEQLETRQVTFSVGLDGAIPTVGNIISVSDEAFAGRANGGRVSAVSDAQYVITVDRDVTVNVGDTLIVNGGNGKSERRNVKSVAGRKITVTAPFTSAEREHVWAVEAPDLKLMRFRVMSITENDDATYAITAIQHEPQKYDAIDYGTDVKPTDITIINPETVDAPASVTITSRHREVQGQTVATLIIGWAQVKGAVAYDIEWRKDDGTWVKVPRTGNVSVEIEGVYSGQYLARVRAVSAFDVQSQPTMSMLTEVKGKIGLPPTIVGLTATGILFGMDLKWGFAQGSGDSDYTEIQVGSAPDVNVAPLGQFSYPTNSHTINGLQGSLSQSYRARLVDKLGNKSVWSAWVTGTTDASADKIMDLIQGQINESALDAALRSEIGKIDTNKTILDSVAVDVSKAKTDIISAISKADTAKADAAANKVDLIAVNEAVANNKSAVETSITTLTNKDISLTNLYTALNSEYTTNKAKVVQDLKTLSDKDISLTNLLTALDSDYKGNKASVTQSLATLTSKDTALTNSITGLTSTVGGHTSSINSMSQTIADNKQSIAQTKTDLRSEFTTATTIQDTRDANSPPKYYYDNYPYKTIKEFKLRSVMGVDGLGNYCYVETNVKWATVTGGSINQLLVTDDGRTYIRLSANETTWKLWVEKEDTVGSAAKVAEAKAALDGRINQTNASVTSEAITRANEDSALSGRINTVAATAGTNKSAIQAEVTARANAVSAVATSVETLQTTLTNINTIAHFDMNNDWVNWTNWDGGGNLFTSSAGVGIGDESGNDAAWLIRNDNIPLKSGAIYRVTARVWKRAGAGRTYVGVAGVATNGTSFVNSTGANSNGAQYYVGNNTDFGWQEFTGYIAADGTDNKGLSVVNLHRDAKFFRPLVVVNYQNHSGLSYIDYFKVELVDGTSTASIEETKTTVNGLSAQYTLKLDVGGRVSGFGLASSATQSEFAINADRFWIAPPTGSSKGKSPFMVLTSPQTINGTVVPAGTYMQAAFIHDGSIDTAKIKNAAIKSAQIDDLAVTTAKIGLAQVDTLQIKGQAIIVPRVQVFEDDVYIINANLATGATFGSVSLDAQGGSVVLQLTMSYLSITRTGGSSDMSGNVYIDFIRDDTVRVGRLIRPYGQNTAWEFLTIPTVVDTPPSGMHTYSIKVWATSAAQAQLSLVRTRSIFVLGAKR